MAKQEFVMKKLFLLLGLASVLVMFAGCAIRPQKAELKTAVASKLGVGLNEIQEIEDVRYHGTFGGSVTIIARKVNGERLQIDGDDNLFNIVVTRLSPPTPQVTAVPKQQ